MSKTIPYAILILLLLSSCQMMEQRATDDQYKENRAQFDRQHPDFANKLEAKVEGLFREDSIAGDFLLAVVDENGLAYSHAMNRAILAGNPSDLTNDSPIYVASHTKSFTGTLLKMLEEQGEVDLNGSLNTYLPELDYRGEIDTEEIEVRQLLNHTHGTFSTRLTWKTAFLGYDGGNSELIQDMNGDFLHDPSHRFRYSNVGPILAAMVAEEVTGNSWKDEMAKHIFKPLGMNNTSAYVSDFDRGTIRPSVTVAKNNRVVESGFYKEDITMHASGGILSTVNDLSTWLQVNINQDPALLGKEGWKALHESTTTQDRNYFTYHRTGYSLGWDIAEYQKDTILTRFGSLGGIMFHISFIPSRKVGVIAFSSDSRTPSFPHLMANYAYNLLAESDSVEQIYEQEKALYETSFKRWSNQPLPVVENEPLELSDNHDRYVGHYENEEGWPAINIEKTGDSYVFHWGVLSGDIHKGKEDEPPYLAPLGVLNRSFEIRNDSLFTGSLVYVKK